MDPPDRNLHSPIYSHVHYHPRVSCHPVSSSSTRHNSRVARRMESDCGRKRSRNPPSHKPRRRTGRKKKMPPLPPTCRFRSLQPTIVYTKQNTGRHARYPCISPHTLAAAASKPKEYLSSGNENENVQIIM